MLAFRPLSAAVREDPEERWDRVPASPNRVVQITPPKSTSLEVKVCTYRSAPRAEAGALEPPNNREAGGRAGECDSWLDSR